MRNLVRHTEGIGTQKDIIGGDTGAAVEAGNEITTGIATGHQGREEGPHLMNATDTMMAITRERQTGMLTMNETDIVQGAEDMKQKVGEHTTTAPVTDVEETVGATDRPAPRPSPGMAKLGGDLGLAARGNGVRAQVLPTMSGELKNYV